MSPSRAFGHPLPAFIVALFGVVGIFATVPAVAQQPIPPLNHNLQIGGTNLTVSFPDGWSTAQQGNLQKLLNVTTDQQAGLNVTTINQVVQINISIETRLNAEDALLRLHQIGAEGSAPAKNLTINGFPAVQRTQTIATPLPGGTELELDLASAPRSIEEVTTAVAVSNLIVRLEAQLTSDESSLTSLVFAIGQSIQTKEVPIGLNSQSGRLHKVRLHSLPKIGRSNQASRAALPDSRSLDHSIEPPPRTMAATVEAAVGNMSFDPLPDIVRPIIFGTIGNPASEPEIAVSTDGLNIVAAQQFLWVSSNDGGLTFSSAKTFPNSSNGDSSLAFGNSGAFYEATINGNSTTFNVSTDNGKNFSFRASAFTCPSSGANACAVPDQEHIAADRTNGSATGDQVYSAFRQCGQFCNNVYGLTCSTNGGSTWNAPNYTTGDFPRITVGQDGSVYVVYQSGNNIMLNKYNSCAADNTMTPIVGFPRTITTLSGNSLNNCPVPGLDRCNSGNKLASWMVTVDDANANHVYTAYAVNTVAVNSATGAGSENIVVQDSTDGGVTWNAARTVTVNSTAIQARRYMPWLCAINGTAYASWYDRRNSTATNNDLTDYFASSAALDGGGNLVGGTEFQMNATNSADRECEAGQAVGSANSWPGSSRSPSDSTSCSQQPQLGGVCQHSPPNATDTNTPCNFNVNTCTNGEVCTAPPLGGSPKYGDYNGNACAAGRLYSVWASATAPPGTAATNRIDLYFRSVRAAGAPLALCRDVTVPTDPNVCSAASASINNGSSDPDGDAVTVSQAPPGPYQLGSTGPVTLTAKDSNGDLDFCAATVTVVDQQPPNISCPAPVAECTSPGGASVTFNPTVSDNCPALQLPACVPPSGSVFPLGSTPFSCSVVDASGNGNSCSSIVKVQDTTPPTISSVSANPPILWPPNHKFGSVTISVTVNDTCDRSPVCKITGISSNEPALARGSGHTTPDWQITGNLTAKLRAERSGTGTGRVYTLNVQCSDASHNTSSASTTVRVPHDRKRK